MRVAIIIDVDVHFAAPDHASGLNPTAYGRVKNLQIGNVVAFKKWTDDEVASLEAGRVQGGLERDDLADASKHSNA